MELRRSPSAVAVGRLRSPSAVAERSKCRTLSGDSDENGDSDASVVCVVGDSDANGNSDANCDACRPDVPWGDALDKHYAKLRAHYDKETPPTWTPARRVAPYATPGTPAATPAEAVNPMLRTAALRLLGRAHAALGAQAAACEAAERAAGEAAKANYVWVEMLALADLLKWCLADEAESVRSRLRGVVQRMVVSDEDLAEVLGDGVL